MFRIAYLLFVILFFFRFWICCATPDVGGTYLSGCISTSGREEKSALPSVTRTPALLPLKRANSFSSAAYWSNKMFLTRSEYDRGVNTFSPEGRLFQVEYAIEAIKLGSTAIGIQTAEGVCLAVEKRITSPLMEPSSIEKIVEIDTHIGCAMSGLIADAKTLIDKARVETQNHWFTYNETMTVESVTQAVSNLALQFGEEDADPGAMSRPFGVALLFGGLDEKGPQLYHMDPSGTFVQCDARAIGSASEGAQSSLQEVYHKSMTLKDAIKSSLTILKQVMEEKLNATNIELATIEPGKTFHMYSKEELEDVIKDI
ncbi:hypothetical protein SKAU_G00171620 [Synaphobranchus kaupii]|uniref:Proteasome subunit alpha type-5 n=1 Tax=Synaphobranchus kaupii TaxID=118154 RepID=A0A9Q1FKH1_SYNKA|nr:hypothetical protein SKAU_G00171620 [Synaphobranchus kaupii]